MCQCFMRKKRAWLCAIIAAAVLSGVVYFIPDLQRPIIVGMIWFAFIVSVIMACCMNQRFNTRQTDTESNTGPPKYEEVMAMSPHREEIPPTLQYNNELNNTSTANGTAPLPSDSEVPPSYDEVVAQPLFHSNEDHR